MLIQKMKHIVKNNLEDYLDSSRCFNATLLAETLINEDDADADDEDAYFDAAAQVAEWAVKTYNLNE